jgi:hypothetical protein
MSLCICCDSPNCSECDLIEIKATRNLPPQNKVRVYDMKPDERLRVSIDPKGDTVYRCHPSDIQFIGRSDIAIFHEATSAQNYLQRYWSVTADISDHPGYILIDKTFSGINRVMRVAN